MRVTLRRSTLRSLIAAAVSCGLYSFSGARAVLAQDSTQYHSCNGIYTNKPCDEVEADLESPLKGQSKNSKKPPSGLDEAPAVPTAVDNKPTAVAKTSPKTIRETTVLSPVPTTHTAPAPSISPGPKVDAKATAISKSKKDSSLHNLRMKLSKGKRSFGVDLDISSAVDVCTSSTTSLEECRTVSAALDATLEERITTARLTKVAEDKAKVEATTAAKTQQSQSTVVIVQPNVRATPTPFFIFDTGPLLPVDPSYRRPSRRDPHHREHPKGHRPPPPLPPAPAGGALIDAVPRKNQR
jgi:hypothetical protein